MAADWLDGVAAMLARRFPDWQDALSAAAMWTQHPCVTRHSAAWAPIASQVAVENRRHGHDRRNRRLVARKP